MWLSALEIVAARLRSVTEIVPESPFLCVNKSPIRYGFNAGAKAIRYGMNIAQLNRTYPCVIQNNRKWFMIDSRHEVYDQLIQSYLCLSQVFIGCQQTLIVHWIKVLAYFSQGYIKLFLWIDREEKPSLLSSSSSLKGLVCYAICLSF